MYGLRYSIGYLFSLPRRFSVAGWNLWVCHFTTRSSYAKSTPTLATQQSHPPIHPSTSLPLSLSLSRSLSPSLSVARNFHCDANTINSLITINNECGTAGSRRVHFNQCPSHCQPARPRPLDMGREFGSSGVAHLGGLRQSKALIR